MTRKIERTYTLTERDVREAILAWLKSKDLPAPDYVGNTDTVEWATDNGNTVLRWFEQDEI
jgi:hypothetical protein